MNILPVFVSEDAWYDNVLPTVELAGYSDLREVIDRRPGADRLLSDLRMVVSLFHNVNDQPRTVAATLTQVLLNPLCHWGFATEVCEQADMDFVRRLARARELRFAGLSLREVAEESGVNMHTVAKLDAFLGITEAREQYLTEQAVLLLDTPGAVRTMQRYGLSVRKAREYMTRARQVQEELAWEQ